MNPTCPQHQTPHDDRNLCAFCEVERQLREEAARFRSIKEIMAA